VRRERDGNDFRREDDLLSNRAHVREFDRVTPKSGAIGVHRRFILKPSISSTSGSAERLARPILITFAQGSPDRIVRCRMLTASAARRANVGECSDIVPASEPSAANANVVVLGWLLRNLAAFLVASGSFVAGLERAEEALRLGHEARVEIDVAFARQRIATATALRPPRDKTLDDERRAARILGFVRRAIGRARRFARGNRTNALPMRRSSPFARRSRQKAARHRSPMAARSAKTAYSRRHRDSSIGMLDFEEMLA
jgi:hypothetical protein